MSDPTPKDRPSDAGLDRRSFLTRSSLVAAGTALTAAGLAAPSAEAGPAAQAVEKSGVGGNDDWKAGWLAS